MMSEELIIKYRENYFGLKYENILKIEHNDSEQIILPGLPFEIGVNIFIDEEKLGSGSNHESHINELIAQSLLSGEYWKSNELYLSLLINDHQSNVNDKAKIRKQMEEEFSFKFKVECGIFKPIFNELKEVCQNGINKNINCLDFLKLEFRINKLNNEMKIISLLEGMNYLMMSLIVDLEFKFPMIFSFYGRNLFKINYNYLSMILAEFGKKDKFIDCFDNIKKVSLVEYNTVKVLMECSSTSHRYNGCGLYKKNFESKKLQNNDNVNDNDQINVREVNRTQNIKNKVFPLNFFNQSSINSVIGEDVMLV